MAHGARLVLGGLVVVRSHGPAGSSIHVGRMTTEAEEVDVVDLQHARIRGSMRSVAGKAALLGLHRSMLEDERPHGVGVTLRANGELPCRGPHLMAGLRPVRIVTVAALDQPNINAMAVRPRELRLLRRMTSVTEFRLRLHQHEVDVFGVVRIVATRTSDTGGQVLRLGKVLGLQAGLVTLRADRSCLRRTQSFEANDLRHIAAAINMRLRGTMAGLTAVLIAF